MTAHDADPARRDGTGGDAASHDRVQPQPEPEATEMPEQTADLLPVAPAAGLISPTAGLVVAELVREALPDEDGLDPERAQS